MCGGKVCYKYEHFYPHTSIMISDEIPHEQLNSSDGHVVTENIPLFTTTTTTADAADPDENLRSATILTVLQQWRAVKWIKGFVSSNSIPTTNTRPIELETGTEGSTATQTERFGIVVFAKDGKLHILAAILKFIIDVIQFFTHFGAVTSKGRSKTVREIVSTLAVVFVLVYIFHKHAETKIDFMKAEKNEIESCHVCMDTSKTPVAPCAQATESDFTTHLRKMDMLVTMMKDHINHDGDACMSSFHIGSRACAVALKGSFTTYVYFNPIEISSEWDDPPAKYKEGSDFYTTKELIRERPRLLRIKYTQMVDGNISTDTVSLVGSDAVCMCHVLEVMNGTHAALYSDTIAH